MPFHELPSQTPSVSETGELPPLEFRLAPPPLRIYSNGADRERTEPSYDGSSGKGYNYERTCMEFLLKTLPQDYFVIGAGVLDRALDGSAQQRISVPDFLIFRRVGKKLFLKGGAEAKAGLDTSSETRGRKILGFLQHAEIFRRDHTILTQILSDNIGQITPTNHVIVPPNREMEFAFISPTRPRYTDRLREKERLFLYRRRLSIVFLTVPIPASNSVQTAA